VDDGDPGFETFGPAEYWWTEQGIGYGGDLHWTWSNGSVESNWGRWAPLLPVDGSYEIAVFVPSNFATSYCPYRVYSGGELLGTVWVDQSLFFDQWVVLGSFDLAAGGAAYVTLSDATGEPVAQERVCFDAVRFSLLATATPAPSPRPSATPTAAPPSPTPSPPPTETPLPPTVTMPPPSPTSVPTATPLPPTPTQPAPTFTPLPPAPGDVDGDGRITTSDALLCFQIALGSYQPTPEEAARADVDGDGEVTTTDALCIFQEALGMSSACFG
jgi:hypothetical protein